MPDAFGLLLLVAFFLVMWLLFIRPQQRRQRELASMQGSLEVGDEVMLTSGVYGVLQGLDEESARLEVADGVVIRVARPAVGRVLTPAARPADDAAHDDAGEPNPHDATPTRDDDVSEEN